MRDAHEEGLQEFLARALSHRLLKPHEEKALARRFQAGDDRARHELIECNMRLVISIARYYRNRGQPFGDVIQDGVLGLDRAARKFDPERGLRFSTYATLWIRQAIQRGLSGAGASTIRLPPEVAARRAKAEALTREGEYTLEELAAELEESVDVVRQALEAAQVVVSLNRELAADDDYAVTLMDTIADPYAADPADELPADVTYLYEALDVLPAAQRRVLELRFGFDGHPARSLAEVAEIMGKSTTTVQAAQREALKTLRQHLDASLV